MRKRILPFPLVVLLCLPFGCQDQSQEAAKGTEVNVEADVAAIRTLLDEWVRLYNAGDFERLVAVFYAEQAIIISPDVPVRKGKDAILLGIQRNDELSQEHVDGSFAEDVRVSGDLAVAWGIDTGTSTPRSGGKPVKYTVNWLMAFERQSDGTWKCLYEMWNINPPPGTAEKAQPDELI